MKSACRDGLAERRDVAGHASVRDEVARRLRHAECHRQRVDGAAHSARGRQTGARVRQVRAGLQAVLSVRTAAQGRRERHLLGRLRMQVPNPLPSSAKFGSGFG